MPSLSPDQIRAFAERGYAVAGPEVDRAAPLSLGLARAGDLSEPIMAAWSVRSARPRRTVLLVAPPVPLWGKG